ncbi:acetyl-CoA carboxylase biotin carboxyl carrier protein [Pleurocapsales cyanobacterium LEGE 06147]|nr:acetyl-CoA carboxylase biotin carboxyl carrier protein [Pleurocapsales cyanobacterium LEGE 06147]
MSIDFQELRELLSAIAQTNITEFTLKSEEFELSVRKGATLIPEETNVGGSEVVPFTDAPPAPKVAVMPATSTEAPPLPKDKKWIAITSPMVGTFYRAPAPGEAPFVEVGDRISKSQTVCIIEAMKLMNEIEAEVSGQVMEIVIENGEPVEYGQTLIWINPE